MRSILRAVPATVPDPVLNQARRSVTIEAAQSLSHVTLLKCRSMSPSAIANGPITQRESIAGNRQLTADNGQRTTDNGQRTNI